MEKKKIEMIEQNYMQHTLNAMLKCTRTHSHLDGIFRTDKLLVHHKIIARKLCTQ